MTEETIEWICPECGAEGKAQIIASFSIADGDSQEEYRKREEELKNVTCKECKEEFPIEDVFFEF